MIILIGASDVSSKFSGLIIWQQLAFLLENVNYVIIFIVSTIQFWILVSGVTHKDVCVTTEIKYINDSRHCLLEHCHTTIEYTTIG